MNRKENRIKEIQKIQQKQTVWNRKHPEEREKKVVEAQILKKAKQIEYRKKSKVAKKTQK